MRTAPLAGLAGACYEAGTPLIPAAHQSALVLEQLEALDRDPAAALQRAGLTAARLRAPGALLTPLQYLELLRAARTLLGEREAAFVLGQALLPGHFGAASHALLRAPTLRRALEVLVAHPARLSPLLAAHWVVEGPLCALYFTETGASGGLRAFLVELQMAAVVSMADWLAGERLPWRCCFNRAPPRDTEAHEAHLGTRLRFDCRIDAMLIDAAWLDRPWPGLGPRAAAALPAATLARQAEAEEPRHALLSRLYRHLLAACLPPLAAPAPSLEPTAAHFGLSPATFKRRLAAHGTHFQAELDQARAHVALLLIHCRGQGNDEVARQLGFNDAANFRRSLKRWTGLTPARLREALGLA
ncbi:MAG TPA: AraC family transcriptional regulator ligand-binding domain-containing protein [Methylibium sp.]|uniref:AraC family transcriptional regulator n=1 Tax=Methylibium sp. TaxID=2067992 RepID=UPI002DB973FA|nr:AraC family transcriptional regulator ligand-binding domain-containing protein [Methylibium sp.]HEU4458854.1 AraC family transcriptional regulator ligand-binding domain-containing protein [Methylibium sp.]